MRKTKAWYENRPVTIPLSEIPTKELRPVDWNGRWKKHQALKARKKEREKAVNLLAAK